MSRSLFFLLFLFPGLAFSQEPAKVPTKTVHATVYLSGAEVKNTGSTSLRQGTNQLVFTNLSPFTDPASIRISADKEVTITGVNVKTNFLDDAELPEAFRTLAARLKEAEFNLQVRQSHKRVYEQERELLLANKDMLGGDSKLTVEDLLEVANLYRTRLKEIEIRILEIGQEEAELSKQVDKLRAQMGDRQNNLNQNRMEVEVTVMSRAPGQTHFELIHVVPTAGWSPSYEIRTDDASSNVRLIYKANVFQSSAIDWSDTRISLSTGNPAIGGMQPKLQPDYVDFYESLNKPGISLRGARTEGTYEYVDGMKTRDVAAAPTVLVSEGNVNVYYDIQLPYNIPSTQTPTGVEIQQFDLPAEYQHLAIPKLDRTAFLIASVKGWEKLNLLPGPVNIYNKNAFVGQSYIDPAQTEEKLELSLGRDNGVIVEKKDVNEVRKDAGLLGSNKKDFHYKFSVKNTRQRALNIRVEDQLPLSRNRDIEVEQENLSGGQYNPETGIITWTLALQPGETREFDLKYSIKYPKGQRINR